MLNFLFRGKSKAKRVSQHETVKTLIEDLNEIIGTMADKPKIVVDPNSGALELQMPDQMPDEALALLSRDDAEDKQSA